MVEILRGNELDWNWAFKEMKSLDLILHASLFFHTDLCDYADLFRHADFSSTRRYARAITPAFRTLDGAVKKLKDTLSRQILLFTIDASTFS
jgi:hypothetical protein